MAALYRQLSEVLDESWAGFIVAYRQYGPYSGQKPANLEQPVRLDLRKPGRHSIASELDLVNAKVRIPETQDGPSIVVVSPFSSDPAEMREYLPELLDQATVVREPVIRGRVNVNLAPRVVLQGVPGLDEELARRIVDQRRSPVAEDDATRRHAAWLLLEGIVSLEQMKSLAPYLTTGGDVVRAQIVGFLDTPGPSARIEVVIDASGRRPRRLYWKDLRVLGRGASLEMLGAPVPGEATLNAAMGQPPGFQTNADRRADR